MAIYEYRCEQDGVFEVILPLGTAPAIAPCSRCGRGSRRILSALNFRSSTQRAWTVAMDRADKSRYEPEVVSTLPPSGARSRTIPLTPTLRGLPRP